MPTAFLITPFSAERARHESAESFRAVQHAIESGALAAGVELVHPAELGAAGVVMDQVREQIGVADGVLAVISGENPNVYYELGIALERAARPAILISRSGTEVPLDVRHHRYITYAAGETAASLALRIEQAIRETAALP